MVRGRDRASSVDRHAAGPRGAQRRASPRRRRSGEARRRKQPPPIRRAPPTWSRSPQHSPAGRSVVIAAARAADEVIRPITVSATLSSKPSAGTTSTPERGHATNVAQQPVRGARPLARSDRGRRNATTLCRSKRREHVVLARPSIPPHHSRCRASRCRSQSPPQRGAAGFEALRHPARPRRMWSRSRGIPVSAAISRCVSPETTLSSRTRRRSPVSCATTSRACAASCPAPPGAARGRSRRARALPREALDPLVAPPGAGGR